MSRDLAAALLEELLELEDVDLAPLAARPACRRQLRTSATCSTVRYGEGDPSFDAGLRPGVT